MAPQNDDPSLGAGCTLVDGFPLCPSSSKDTNAATTNVPQNPGQTIDNDPSVATSVHVSPSSNGAKPERTGTAQAVDPSATTGVLTASDGSVLATGSPLPAPSSSGGSNGVSKGAVAGIAIATAIIGAAIALLIAFVLFKRRNNKNSRLSPYDSTPELASYAKGGAGQMSYVRVSQTPAPAPIPAPVAAASVPPQQRRSLNLEDLSNSSDFLAGVLSPAADEHEVKSRVAALFNAIQQHVEHFYRDIHANITQSMERDIARFSKKGCGIVEMLQNSSMPTVAIKHALTGYTLSITSPEEEDETLFPSDINGIRSKEQFNQTSDLSATYILYKRLAVHLHSSAPATNSSKQSDIREAAEHFAITFFPWANPTFGDQEREEDLAKIIGCALDLSIWMYGQPYLYGYVWEGVGRRGTVVAPGLTKVSDSKGRIGDRPQLLLDPVVVPT